MYTCLLVVLLAVAAIAQNPFSSGHFYVNPSYQAELDSSISSASGTVKSTLQSMRNIASAYWIDVMAKITGTGTKTVEGILTDAASKNPAPTVVFIVYDLPNRDCHAKASNGEICCYNNSDGTCNYEQTGDCAEGIQRYKTQYIDPLVKTLARFTKVPVVAIIEPDSLPNLATNQADNHCGNSATTAAYKQGIPYAVNQLATLKNVVQYLDGAHGGWLGWPNNMQQFVSLVQGMNILSKVRGFATNTANYQPIGIPCPSVGYCLNGQNQNNPCCSDPCKLSSQYNPAHNEMNYVQELHQSFSQGGYTPYFVIDTGRNGIPNMRADCANWCNIRGAGIGLSPTTKTNGTNVDAYYWLKTPGESDGCTQDLPSGSACARFDSFCGSADSIGSKSGEPRAPVAGNWFDYEVKQLASNAHMSDILL